MGFKSTCLSLTALLFVAFVFVSIISDDIQGIEGRGEEEDENDNEIRVAKEYKSSKSAPRKREAGSPYMDDYGNNEVNIGGKRFKLYEKKHLNHKKAEAFCKKKDGKLAEAMNLEEMRRLQMLLLRAKSISDDIWVGADKKEWKKHSLKMQRRPNFGPDPMIFGGGPTQMCPALSVSTRSLLPVMCMRDLPFICEFDPNQKPKQNAVKPSSSKSKEKGGKTPKTPKTLKPTKSIKMNTEGGMKSNKRRGTVKVEMRRKREIVALDSPQVQGQEQGQGLSLTTGSPLSSTTTFSADSETGSETTSETSYGTESPVEAAAEHNIGFSPHVEHVQGESLLKPLISEKTDSTAAPAKLKNLTSNSKLTGNLNPHIFHATVSTKISVVGEGENKDGKPTTSTIYDPDQMLIDLIDEQTMNLTAIELESSAVTVSVAPSPVSTEMNSNSLDPSPSLPPNQILEMKGLSHSGVKLIESNDLSTSAGSVDADEFGQDKSHSANHSISSSNSSNSTATASSILIDDFMDLGTTMGNGSSDSGSTVEPQPEPVPVPEPAGDDGDKLTFTSPLIPLSAVSGTPNPTLSTEVEAGMTGVVTESGKRALRNASHSHELLQSLLRNPNVKLESAPVTENYTGNETSTSSSLYMSSTTLNETSSSMDDFSSNSSTFTSTETMMTSPDLESNLTLVTSTLVDTVTTLPSVPLNASDPLSLLHSSSNTTTNTTTATAGSENDFIAVATTDTNSMGDIMGIGNEDKNSKTGSTPNPNAPGTV